MRWWCAATTAQWDWTWRPYPGVWLAILLLAALYVRSYRRARHVGPISPGRPIAFGSGLLVLWLVLDWPVGALGGGYLLSVHTAQYVALSLIVMPLLVAGVPPALYPADGFAGAILKRLAHPVLGLMLYSVIMAVTHVPAVTDRLMATQPGSFVIDLLWLAGAFALWWPVQAPQGMGRLSPAVRIGYLFLATIPPTIPAAFMVFADYPLYSLYELAPRAGLPAGTDQQAAGLIMKVGADPILWLAMAIVFFRWQRAEDDGERRDQSLSPQEQVT
jgi:cytochrome c oxidase assembly factor CtaG